MKSLILTLSTAAVLGASVGALPAAADTTDYRQYNQQYRIQQGARSGQLTGREYQALQAEQARIAAFERRAKSDGFVDPWERAQINKAQSNASRHIYSEKHDGESRWNRWWNRRGHADRGHNPWYRRWW
jgi:uncharacterized membrane protein YebE (DUF533 family)